MITARRQPVLVLLACISRFSTPPRALAFMPPPLTYRHHHGTALPSPSSTPFQCFPEEIPGGDAASSADNFSLADVQREMSKRKEEQKSLRRTEVDLQRQQQRRQQQQQKQQAWGQVPAAELDGGGGGDASEQAFLEEQMASVDRSLFLRIIFNIRQHAKRKQGCLMSRVMSFKILARHSFGIFLSYI